MDYIREFLRSRWDGEKQLLNLENMGADPILKNHAIRPPGDSRANEFVGPATMKLAGEMFPNVRRCWYEWDGSMVLTSSL